MKIVKIHEPCRVRSSENIAQKRKLSIIPEILPIPPASTKQKQRNEQRNEKKSEQLHLIENPNKHKEIINQSIYAKAFEKRFSNIPCKSSSFYLLYLISKRDQSFNISLPNTIVLNCDFETPVIISNKLTLEFQPFFEDSSGVKQKFYEILTKTQSKSLIPVGIIKYSNGHKRILHKAEEIFDNLSDISQNILLQQFISPRGLRVTKFRVVLKNNQAKVYLITNNLRYDSKNDSTEPIKHEMNDKIVKTSVMNHAKIMKYINNLSMSHLPDLEKMPKEKKNIYEIFKFDPTISKNNKLQQKNIENKDTDKYLTQTDIQKSQFYEGKATGYMEIVKISQYLQNKINAYYLKDEILDEFSVDFLQDYNQN